MDFHLSVMLLTPFVGALVILALPSAASAAARWLALGASGIGLLCAVVLFLQFDAGTINYQFTEHYAWVATFNLAYFVGVDGISLPLVILAALGSFVAVMASWGVQRAPKGYFALLLMLAGSLTGVFVALDLVLFLMFWQLALLPLYLLISIWGEGGESPAARALLSTMAGAMVLLLAIFALYFAGETQTFDMATLIGSRAELSHSFQYVLWLGFFVAFAILMPLFPFHVWVPAAQAASPTPVAILQAAVMLKIGAYGILRISYSILPVASADLAYACLAVYGVFHIVYGALGAIGENDLRRFVAYFSLSQIGLVCLGMASVTAAGLGGASMHLFTHGLVVMMLLLIVGAIEERTGERRIDRLGGLAAAMPIASGFAAIAFFAALGLPGFGLFMSELHILLGAYYRYPWLALVAAGCVVVVAAFLLRTLQRVFLGTPSELPAPPRDLSPRDLSPRDLSPRDLSYRESGLLLLLTLLLLITGVAPSVFLDAVNASLGHLNRLVLPHL